MKFALNHMAVPRLSCDDALRLSQRLGCAGVEFRNDLNTPLFAGSNATAVAALARTTKQKIFALAEVKSFNNLSDATLKAAQELAAAAKASGAQGITLIPRNDGKGIGNGERQANLRLALRELKPILDAAGLIGFIEPLGFPISSLKHKSEALDAMSAVDGLSTFKLIHDTFHHHIAGETEVFAAHTGIVHVSGVTDPHPSLSEMQDAHRELVDAKDRLRTVQQLRALIDAGFDGPVSFEPFAPEVHNLADPGPAIAASIAFLRGELAPIDA